MEAEWEYAARAGTDLVYAGSDRIDDVAWHNGNSGGLSKPVGLKYPNFWGLYDMSGNVMEYTWDRHAGFRQDDYPSGAVTDPVGQASGNGRVGRGGGWYFAIVACRVSSRFNASALR